MNRSFFLLAIVLIVSSLFAFEVPSNNVKLAIRVQGRVLRDRDDKPVHWAVITLFQDGQVTERTMTNNFGKFELLIHEPIEPDSIVCEAFDYVSMNLPFRGEGGFLQLYLSDNKDEKLKHKPIQWLKENPDNQKRKSPRKHRRTPNGSSQKGNSN